MNTSGADSLVPVEKDDLERAIPTAWRPTLRAVASAFAAGDYGLARGVPSVNAVKSDWAKQVAAYVADYGCTLIELPDDTWSTSTCMWYGSYWDAIVDLWTLEEGRSDLTMNFRVRELGTGFSFELMGVYVP